MTTATKSIAALDVGEKRIGVAITSLAARLPRPLITLERDPKLLNRLKGLIEAESIELLVIGLPRNMSGEPTKQTKYTKQFAEEITQNLPIHVYFQDESLTSVQAEDELSRRQQNYDKASVDALAATYILEDFLHDHPEVVS